MFPSSIPTILSTAATVNNMPGGSDNTTDNQEEKKYIPTPIELFGIECGVGWLPLIEPILEWIKKYNEEHAELSEDEKMKPLQIKEKFARLEIYLNYYTPEIEEMIETAGDKSEHICELCGSEENVGLYDNGWMTTLCHDCAKTMCAKMGHTVKWHAGDYTYRMFPDERPDKLTEIRIGNDYQDLFRLYNKDCVKVMDLMILTGLKVDLTVTSPPYDNLRQYDESVAWDFDKFKDIADRLYQVTNDGGVVVWVVGDSTVKGSETGTSFKQALYFKEIGFNLHDTMIFEKANPIPQNHNRYEQCFEYMFVFSKGKPKVFNPIRVPTLNAGKEMEWGNRKTVMDENQCRRHRESEKLVTNPTKIHKNIFTYPIGGGKSGHPAVFPLQLAIDHILSWSDENSVIFDPFLGSGTTMDACVKTNRNKFIGCEISEKYFEIIREKMEKYKKNGEK